MKVLILAGGIGSKLWPLSRKNYPKQFLKITGDKSLFHQTIERLMEVVSTEDIILITNGDYKFHIKADLNFLPIPHTILEPANKDTAPAIALGIKYCMERLLCKEDEVIFISPSHHIIKPVEKFKEYIKQAEELSKQGYIVTFGIKPTKPETGYGYMKVKNKGSGGKYLILKNFAKNPDLETAKEYIKEGNYYLNSGMFAFCIGTLIEGFKKYEPRISKMIDKSFNEIISNFTRMPEISIDCAVVEKSDRVVILPIDLYWNDISSWDSLYDAINKDENGNIKMGNVVAIDTKRTLIIGNKRLISTIGLEDCLVVETDDAILIAKKGESQKVGKIVTKLNENCRKEALEHNTSYRPWGSYTVLDEGSRYKIKRIIVKPEEKLSLQIHHHRSEHWVVIKGAAKVTIGDKEMFIHENEFTYIPKSTLHRLENPRKIPLEIIEVQMGEYVREDDIVRISDIYGRI